MRFPILLAAALICAVPLAAQSQTVRVFPDNLYYGASTKTKIYVELDWMEDGTHSHRPSQAVVDAIVDTFAAEGYELILDVSNQIPFQSPLDIPSGSNVTNAPNVVAIANTHFNNKNDSRYFYSLWIHNYSINGSLTTSSGLGDLPGRTHLVSLGSFSGNVGTFSNQVGTFVHEFGHNLNQGHAGSGGSPNYKPNYFSVMNYRYQLSGLIASSTSLASSVLGCNTYGYSHGKLASMNENSLSEPFGVGLGKSVDWNCDGDTLDTGVQRDLTQSTGWCGTQVDFSTLTDYNNWGNINPWIRTDIAPGSADSQSPPVSLLEPCITAEEHQDFLATLTPEQLAVLDAQDAAGAAGMRGVVPTSFYVHNHGTAILNVTSITPQTAAPWINVSPTSFSVAPGSHQQVSINVNNAAAPYGPSSVRLLVASNDTVGSPYAGGIYVYTNGTTPPASATSWEIYE